MAELMILVYFPVSLRRRKESFTMDLLILILDSVMVVMWGEKYITVMALVVSMGEVRNLKMKT